MAGGESQGDESESVIPVYSDDLREIIGWQLEKFHHIQVQSRGIVAAQLTVIAIVVTVYFSFIHPIPDIVTEQSQIEAAISGLSIGPAAALLILLVNLALAYVFFVYGLYNIGRSMYKLVHNILRERLQTGWASNGDFHLQFVERDADRSVRDIGYALQIQRNEERIRKLHEEYISATLRLLLGLGIIWGGYQIRIYIVELKMIELIFLNVVYFAPAAALLYFINGFYSRVFSEKELIDPEFEENEESLFSYFTETTTDKLLGVLTSILAGLGILIWGVSWALTRIL